MAKTATKKTDKTSTPSPAPERERVKDATNITLITTGYRTRLHGVGNRTYAALPMKTGGGFNHDYTTQNELEKAWERAVTGVAEEDFVMGAGDPGVFSMRFAEYVTQITPLANVWCPSNGLGMVCLGAKYPQYDLGDAEVDIRLALPKGDVDNKLWWKFVCNLSGNSITTVVTRAIKSNHRVILAMPGLQYFRYKHDLNTLIETLTSKSEERLIVAREHIRFVGPDLEAVLPPKLLPCAMPYDKVALDRLVPGVRSHGTRRIAKLLLDVSPTPANGRTSPLQDFEAMQAAFKDKSREPIVYETGGPAKTSLTKVSDEDAASMVAEYAQEVGPIPTRIMRMMKAEGYSMKVDRVSDILKKLSKAKTK